jgi:hypothetical protein
MEPLAAAEQIVADRFPDATWAMLTGSVIGPQRTAGSDLDIVVLREDGPGFREGLRFEGWPASSRPEAQHAPDARPRRDDRRRPGRSAGALCAGARARADAERDRRRYSLTDLLDDLTHATDDGERTVIANALWIETAEAAPAFNRRWISRGKWLLRELRELDPALATEWLAARDDPSGLATRTLAEVGGTLFEGYRA